MLSLKLYFSWQGTEQLILGQCGACSYILVGSVLSSYVGTVLSLKLYFRSQGAEQLIFVDLN